MTIRKPRKMCHAGWLRRLFLVIFGLALKSSVAFAQEDRPVPKSYLNKGNVHLPIQIDDRVRPQLKEIQLFVREGPQGPWILKEKVPGTQTSFTFRAAHEGEYWFSVVTVDRDGRSIPADVTKEPPNLVVVIDNTPPQADAQLIGSTPEGHQIRCEVRDANPNPAQDRFYYQTRDLIWRSLDAVGGQPNTYCIPNQAAITGKILVSARDLAGNVVSREINLVTLSATPTAPNNPAITKETVGPVPTSVRTEISTKPGPNSMPPGTGVEQASYKVPFAVASGSDSPPRPDSLPPAPEAKPTGTGNSPKRHYFNSPRVGLDYTINKVGPSGVSRIDVYVTAEKGDWKKLTTIDDPSNHSDVDLPGEGAFGIRLVATNGNGFGAKVPGPADLPTAFFEIDLTGPDLKVEIDPVTKFGTIDIRWQVSDKNLSSEPIQILYASQPGGPWQAVTGQLKNDGLYRWTLPRSVPPNFVIRVEARDLAGNVSHVDAANPVPLDLTEPDVSLTGLAPIAVQPAPVSSSRR